MPPLIFFQAKLKQEHLPDLISDSEGRIIVANKRCFATKKKIGGGRFNAKQKIERMEVEKVEERIR